MQTVQSIGSCFSGLFSSLEKLASSAGSYLGKTVTLALDEVSTFLQQAYDEYQRLNTPKPPKKRVVKRNVSRRNQPLGFHGLIRNIAHATKPSAELENRLLATTGPAARAVHKATQNLAPQPKV